MDMARLIEHGGADVAGQNIMNGMTLLHMASELVNLRLLMEHGADAAAQNKKGLTPLHGASLRGHLDMARLLIEYGADAAAQSKHGTPLHWACAAGGDMARLLIEHGADVAAPSEHGTPLQWASSSECGYVDQALVRLLIEHGADTADPILQI
jgi:ankyrin repeat protein